MPSDGVVSEQGVVTRHLDPDGADGAQVTQVGEAFRDAVAGGRYFSRRVAKVPA